MKCFASPSISYGFCCNFLEYQSCRTLYIKLKSITWACHAIASESSITCTCKSTKCVQTKCIGITIISVFVTLVDICEKSKQIINMAISQVKRTINLLIEMFFFANMHSTYCTFLKPCTKETKSSAAKMRKNLKTLRNCDWQICLLSYMIHFKNSFLDFVTRK